MIQAKFLLGTLKALFDGPAQPGGTGQLSQFSSCGGKDEIIGAVLRIAPIATDEDPALEAAIHLYRSRLNDKIDHWIGKRRDGLRRVAGGFQIFQRHIFLDQTVVLSTNFSSLF